MALPTTPPITAGNTQWDAPPFRSSAGNFYAVGLGTGGADDEIHMVKTTDPTDDAEWGAIDDAGRPVQSVGGIAYDTMATHQVGDLIHIVSSWTDNTGMDDLEVIEYHTFNMATDAWVITDDLIGSIDTDNGVGVTIKARSDGTVVVGHLGLSVKVMGADKLRSYYSIRSTGGTWAAPVIFSTPGNSESDWHICSSVLNPSDDRIHFFLGQQDDSDTPAN